jgi:hypothetical protein
MGICWVENATTLYLQKLARNFAKWRSLSLYSSLVAYKPRSRGERLCEDRCALNKGGAAADLAEIYSSAGCMDHLSGR